MSDPTSIDTVLKEKRQFPPSEAFQRQAHLGNPAEYQKKWEEVNKDPVKFWEDAASQIHWFKKWDQVLIWDEPFAKWFVGATTNAAFIWFTTFPIFINHIGMNSKKRTRD